MCTRSFQADEIKSLIFHHIYIFKVHHFNLREIYMRKQMFLIMMLIKQYSNDLVTNGNKKDTKKNHLISPYRLQVFLEHRGKDEVGQLVGAKTHGATPLVMACRNGHYDVAEYLIEKCAADIEQPGSGENLRIINTDYICVNYFYKALINYIGR